MFFRSTGKMEDKKSGLTDQSIHPKDHTSVYCYCT